LTSKLNLSAQTLPAKIFTGILIFKWLIARRLSQSFGLKRLIWLLSCLWPLNSESCDCVHAYSSIIQNRWMKTYFQFLPKSIGNIFYTTRPAG
jgi:hypothetical protein